MGLLAEPTTEGHEARLKWADPALYSVRGALGLNKPKSKKWMNYSDFDPSQASTIDYSKVKGKKQQRLARIYQAQAQQYSNTYDPNDPYSSIEAELSAERGTSLVQPVVNKKGKVKFVKSAARDTKAEKTFEHFNNALWDDYMKRFKPYEEDTLDPYTKGDGAVEPSVASGQARLEARSRGDRASNIAEAEAQRQQRATGIQLADDELASRGRTLGLNRVLNRVDAQNVAQRAFDERASMVRDYSFDTEATSANRFSNTLVRASAAEAERKRAQMEKNASGGIGGLVGMVGGAAAGAYFGQPALGASLGGAIGGAIDG